MDRRRIAAFLAGAAAFVPLYSPQSLLPLLRSWVGHDAFLAGLIISAGTFGVAVAAPFIGLFADRLGRRRVIVLASFSAVVPTLLAALSPSVHWLIAFRFLEGLTLPAIFAVTVAYVNEEWQAHEARAVTGLYVAGTIMGGFSGRFLSGVVAEFLGWRFGFVALALTQLLLAVLIFRWLAPDRPRLPRSAGTQPKLWSLLRMPQLRSAYAAGFSLLFALVAGFTYISLRLAEPPFDLGPGGLSMIFTVYLVGVMITPVSGRLLNAFGHARVLSGAWTVAVAGLILTTLPWLAAVVLGLTLFSAGLFVAQTTATSFVGEAVPQARGAAIGLYVTCYYLGGSVGGILPAPLWTHFGWPGVVVLIAMTAALSVQLGRRAFRVPQPARVAGETQ